MFLGGRTIQTRPFPSTASPNPAFKFDPFGEELPNEVSQGINRKASSSSRLKADSRRFVPPGWQPSRESPWRDRRSSPSNANSNESKTSFGTSKTSKSMPTEWTVIDRWHNSAAFCE